MFKGQSNVIGIEKFYRFSPLWKSKIYPGIILLKHDHLWFSHITNSASLMSSIIKKLLLKKKSKALEGIYSILYSNKGIYWMPTRWLITAKKKKSLLSPFHWWGNWDLDLLRHLSKMIIINKDTHYARLFQCWVPYLFFPKPLCKFQNWPTYRSR